MSRSALKNIYKLLDESQTETNAAESFVRDLKRSIELVDEQSSRAPSKTYKPSSMQCIRNMYYQRLGVNPDKGNANACLIGICESGTDRHIRVQNAVTRMKDNGIDCEYIDVEKFVTERNLQDIQVVSKQGAETKLFNSSYNMSFMCDGIIRYKRHYFILEIKTETSFKWVNRTGVDQSHYNQATAYSLSLELPEVLFLYINRDNCDMKAYVFEVTDAMRMNIASLINHCEECVMSETVPAKPEDVPRKTCDYCNYKTQCRKDG